MKTLHEWYDRLPEPRRFLTFILSMIVIVAVANIWPLVGFPLMLVILALRLRHLHI